MKRAAAWVPGGVCAAAVALNVAGARGQTFQWIGTLEGYEVLNARAVSGDGRVVVGSARSLTTSRTRAFRWSTDEGLANLGVLPGGENTTGSDATGVSADGSVIVGHSTTASGALRAFRWTAAGGMTELPLPAGQPLNASAGNALVNRDGSIIVGSLAPVPGPATTAFVWTAAAGSRVFNIGQRSIPRVITPEGDVLGHAEVTAGSYAAVRWDLSANRTVIMPDVWVSGINPAATAMWVQRPGFSWQFWTSTTGFVQLVDPAASSMHFGSVTDDGRLFAGQFSNSSGGTAMVWRPAAGAMRAEDYLRRSGVQLPASAADNLGIVWDVSADGRVMTGQGEIFPPGPVSHTGVWVASLPRCGNADFNNDGDAGTDADIEAFFACLAGHCCAACYPGGGDFNGDGDAGTDQDIEAFFRVLAGGSC